MIKSLFTPWQDKSIEPVAGLITKPGLYFVNARAHGLKGLIGGTHSWIVGKLSDGSELVAEVTDIETLEVQGGLILIDPTGLVQRSKTEKAVIVSNRNASQRWFGSAPVVQTYIELTDAKITSFLFNAANSYPLNGYRFKLLYRNCNTFASWAAHYGSFEVALKIGGRPAYYWGNIINEQNFMKETNG